MARDPMLDASTYRVDETLEDGTRVALRAIRPDDRACLVEAFSQLERDSVYTRFFSYRSGLTDDELELATKPDFGATVAPVATVPGDTDEIIFAGARYVMLDGGGDDDGRAEVAFTAEEDEE